MTHSAKTVPPRRVLFVHAHPDDEVISTGVTIASYAAQADTHVTLVTCTLGEVGEVLVPELINLRADRGDQLGGYRIGELERACAELGITDHRFLGGAGRWRDSGMMDTEANDDPRCFWQANLDEASEALVRIVRDIRPQVLVTYDENGAYGHPDHIRAHDVAVRAFTDAADPGFAPTAGPPWQIGKLYETAMPKSIVQAGITYFREHSPDNNPFGAAESADDVPLAVPDEKITTEIVADEFLPAKLAAMRAHRTQMAVDGFFFALADGIGQRIWAVEHFILTRGSRGPNGAGSTSAGLNGGGLMSGSRETDLFAGLYPA